MNPQTPRKKSAFALALGIVSACGGQSGPSGPPASPASAEIALEACTGDTPLVPGVPGSPGHLIPTAISPSGQSELAVMMRTMEADLKAARVAIEEGRPVPAMSERHRRVRCSWPTTPSDRSPAFDVLAVAYLGAVAALEAAPPAEAAAAHGAVLDTCKGCHQQACPGPIAAIESIRLPAK